MYPEDFFTLLKLGFPILMDIPVYSESTVVRKVPIEDAKEPSIRDVSGT